MKKIIGLLLCFSILVSSGCIKDEIETYTIFLSDLDTILNKYVESTEREKRLVEFENNYLKDDSLATYTLLDLGGLSPEINVCINTYVYQNGWTYIGSEQVDETHGPKSDYGIVSVWAFLYKDLELNAENYGAICFAEADYEEDIISGGIRGYVQFNDVEIPKSLENRKELFLEKEIDVTPYEEQIFMVVVYSENDTSKITLDNVLEQADLQYGVMYTITLYKYVIGTRFTPEENHF